MDEPSESEVSFDNNSTDSVDSMSDEEECEGTNDQTWKITSVCSFSKNPSKRRAPRTIGCLFRRGLRTRGGARPLSNFPVNKYAMKAGNEKTDFSIESDYFNDQSNSSNMVVDKDVTLINTESLSHVHVTDEISENFLKSDLPSDQTPLADENLATTSYTDPPSSQDPSDTPFNQDPSGSSSAQDPSGSTSAQDPSDPTTSRTIAVGSIGQSQIAKKNQKQKGKKKSVVVWNRRLPDVPVFEFTETEKLHVEVPDNADPMFFFYLLCPQQFFTDMVFYTNQYAETVINSSRPLRRRSRLDDWNPVDVPEMKKFVGVLLMMGVVRLPSYQKYWSTDPFYNNKFASSAMTRDRFLSILRFWHFGNQDDFPGDRLGKVRYLINHVNDTTSNLYTPDLSLDESMVLWRGRLVFREYIKGRKHKYGIF